MILFAKNTHTGEVLIAYSEDPKKRFAELQKKSAARLACLGAIYGDYEDKRALHRQFANAHLKNDWFKADILYRVQQLVALKPVNGPPAANVILGGDRDFADRNLAYRVLSELHARRPIGCVNFWGDQDFERWAREWAAQNNIDERPFYPEWSTRGRVAAFKIGPQMLRAKLDAKVLVVFLSTVASPTSKSLVREARKLGIEVIEVKAGG